MSGGTDVRLPRIAALVGELGEVTLVDSESIVVHVGPTSASIRLLGLSPELDVLAVTQLIAADLPNTPGLGDDVEACAAQLSFGSLRRSDPSGVTSDVLQYYTFPVNGLGDVALLTILHLVLAAGEDAATQLVGEPT